MIGIVALIKPDKRLCRTRIFRGVTYIQKADELIMYEQYIRCQTRDDVLRRDVLIDFAPLIE